MKKLLHNLFLWGGLFVLLKGKPVIAQPIQLVPQKETQMTETSLLPSSQEEGEFWEGTPSSLIKTYFPKIPVHLTSSALRALRVEVLTEKYPPLFQDPVYEKTRLSLFIETGKLDNAREVILETDLSEKEALLLDLEWLADKPKKACEKVSNLIRVSPSLDWKKQNIYCLYASGEEERGKIALELLNDSNTEDLSLLKALCDASSPPPLDPSFASSPFLLTVWGETGQEFPEEVLKRLSPSSLALIAKLEKIPVKTRLLAAEKAFSEGSLSQEDLFVFSQNAPPGTLLGKFKTAFKTQKTEDLLPLLEMAIHDKTLDFIVNVFHSDFLKIEPSLETLSLAPFLIPVFLRGNQKDLAQKWGAFYRREAPDDAIALLPLLHLAFPQIKWEDAQLQAWQAYQSRVNPTKAAQNSYALRRLFEALGESPGLPMKGEPSPPSWRQEKALFEGEYLGLLEAAVKSHRKGEVLLFILTMIGETPLKDLLPDQCARLLEALRQAGYITEARALALDYLLAKEF